MPAPVDLEATFEFIERRLGRGKVVPVLGAGANLCDRPDGQPWKFGNYLPDSRELAEALAQRFPETDPEDLALVAMQIIALAGSAALVEELHRVFDADYPPNSLHHFLAQKARASRASDDGEGMLVLTTNYDDSLERAFRAEDEPYQLVTYIADGPYKGHFRHHLTSSKSVVIDSPTTYLGFRFDQTSIIAKIHGAVRRTVPLPVDLDWNPESYVITEDQYIDYINRNLFPVRLGEKIKSSHLLFLGYSLRDWNFRVMLHRLWEEQSGLTYRSWAVQPNPRKVDTFAWRQRDVEILPVTCRDFLAGMSGTARTEF